MRKKKDENTNSFSASIALLYKLLFFTRNLDSLDSEIAYEYMTYIYDIYNIGSDTDW